MSVGVVGSMTIRPGMAAEFERVYTALIERIRHEEPDTLVYQLVRVLGRPNAYKTVELYRDQAAFDTHRTSAALRECLPQLSACVEGVPVVERVETVD